MKKKLCNLINIILNLVVIILLIKMLYLKNISSCINCVLTLILLQLTKIINKKTKIIISCELCLLINSFIFGTFIIGELLNGYIIFSWWDNLLHIMGGFILTGIDFFMIDFLSKKKNTYKKLKSSLVIMISFCFSITILVMWEFVECEIDTLLKKDMQKDRIITTIYSAKINDIKTNKVTKIPIKSLMINDEDWLKKYGGYLDIGLYDTMCDLLDGTIGSIIFSFFLYFYLINGKSFIKKLIPRLE